MRNRVIFAIWVLCALAWCGCRCDRGGDRPATPVAKADALDPATLPDREVVCPVCGLSFNAREAKATRVFGGVTHYFLVDDHAEAFAENPEAYLKK